MSLPTPYFEADGLTIYNADCKTILPFLGQFDLLLTDPPYGIKINKSQRLSVTRGFGDDQWDDEKTPQWLIDMAIEAAKSVIIWGGNYYSLPPTRCFLIWDKNNAGRDFADCEFAWTNIDAVARRFIKRPMNMDGGKVHPTQKPLSVIQWAIKQAPDDCKTILDPFMGSGTTLVAARALGRQAVGIEREERYCEAAVNRLRQLVLF